MANRNGWRLIRKSKDSHEFWSKEGVGVIIPNYGVTQMPTGL